MWLADELAFAVLLFALVKFLLVEFGEYATQPNEVNCHEHLFSIIIYHHIISW